MIRSFILTCVLFALVPFAAQAVDPCAGKPAKTVTTPWNAATPAIPEVSELTYCKCLMYPSGYASPPSPAVSLPLIKCLTDTTLELDTPTGKMMPRGLIPYATYHMLTDTAMATYFKPIIAACLSLALALYGYGIFTGSVQSIKSETFLIVLKFAGVYYYIYSAPDLYLHLLDVVTQLCDAISSGASSVVSASDPFWNNCAVDPSTGSVVPPTTSQQIWSMWDCTLNYLLGFSGATDKWIGVVMFAMAFMATLGTGITIAGIIISMIVGLLLLFARFVMTYIMAVLALSFMFFIGYLFVPLMLFKHDTTRGKFTTWLNLCFGYILTPVVMMGYMTMMLIALNTVLFTGTNSLFEKIQYGSHTNVYDPNNTTSPLLAATGNTQDSFMSFSQVDFANSAGITSCSTGVAPAVGPQGAFNNVKFSPTNGSASENTMPATSGRLGFQLKGLNIKHCDMSVSTETYQYPPGCTYQGATGTGLAELYNGGIDSWKYIAGILNSSAAALILIYVMHAVLGYLPGLVDGLVAEGSGSGSIAQTTSGMGDTMSKSMLDAGTTASLKTGGVVRDGLGKASPSLKKDNG